jgi:virulence-associated protein VagC
MPLPPQKVIFGVEAHTAAYRTAIRYRSALEAMGIEVELEQLPQGQHALSWISSSNKSNVAGFAPSFLSHRYTNQAVQALATIGIHPIWIATADKINTLSDLRGKRIAIGQANSPAHEITRILLEYARMKPDELTWINGDPMEAVTKLLHHEVDALVIMDEPEAALVRTLLTEPSISIMAYPHAGVIAQRRPYMQTQVVAQGSIELKGNVPPKDLILLASGHELVISPQMHPSLQRALLDVAVSEHSVASFMQRETEYPEFRASLPLSPTALDYANGERPWMQYAFPYWWGDLVRLIPLVTLPVLLLTGLLLHWFPRLRGRKTDNLLMDYYGQLYFLEDDLFQAKSQGISIQRELLTRLDRLEHEVRILNVPEEFLDRWYSLRTDLAATRLRILEIDSAYSPHFTN